MPVRKRKGVSDDTNARYYLLSNSGVNADQTMQDIETINIQSTYEAYNHPHEVDFEVPIAKVEC